MKTAMAAETAAQTNGFLLAVPAGVGNVWNDEDPAGGGNVDDVGFIDALVAALKAANPGIPNGHVFAFGFSNGGGLTTRLACHSSHIRGVGVVGNYYVSGTAVSCTAPPNGQAVPGWFGAGVSDSIVPVGSMRTYMSHYVKDLTACTPSGGLQTVTVSGMPSGTTCKQFSNCNLGRLCEYSSRGHEVLPDSVAATWSFLTSGTAVSPSPSPPPPSPSPPGQGSPSAPPQAISSSPPPASVSSSPPPSIVGSRSPPPPANSGGGGGGDDDDDDDEEDSEELGGSSAPARTGVGGAGWWHTGLLAASCVALSLSRQMSALAQQTA